MTLGVNIDHVAVLREARRVNDPDILEAMYAVTKAGADQITIHLREDRRHIQDTDAYRIAKLSKIPVNLECSVDASILDIICDIKPHRATLVPEKRQEVTTEGGLDVKKYRNIIADAIAKLKAHAIDVSLFIDPQYDMIDLAAECGADMIELHTGTFANIHAMLYSNLAASHHAVAHLQKSRPELQEALQHSLKALNSAAHYAHRASLKVAAGHGLNYQNVTYITDIEPICELNIGQSIVARSVFCGLEQAVKEMKALL